MTPAARLPNPEHGYDSPRGRQALRVINRAHGRYAISNDDMRYVLSTFVYVPIDWLNRFGWRRLHEHERLAAFHYYRAVGARMGIHGVPDDFDAFWDCHREYERDRFRFAPTNQRIGTYTLDLFASWYPAPLRRAARLGVLSLLPAELRTAFGFPATPRWISAVVNAALHSRAAVVRLLPPRTTSKLTRAPHNRTYPGYPNGYQPADLGAPPPPPDLDPTWLARPHTPTSAHRENGSPQGNDPAE